VRCMSHHLGVHEQGGLPTCPHPSLGSWKVPRSSRTCFRPMNLRQPSAAILPPRGNNVSLSPGESAGVRVSVKCPSNAGALSVPNLHGKDGLPATRQPFSSDAASREDSPAGLTIESEVEFPSSAFGQVEGLPDRFAQIRLRDRHLQAQSLNGRGRPGDTLVFVGLLFRFHGIWFFRGSGSRSRTRKMLPNQFHSTMG